jgi:hypothetical protein
MNRDEVIRLAREAGLIEMDHDCIEGVPLTKLPELIALVAAAEREACAKVCDERVDAEYATGKVDHNEIGWTQACAAAIRARGGMK